MILVAWFTIFRDEKSIILWVKTKNHSELTTIYQMQ